MDCNVPSTPTREQINPFDDLDGRVACEHLYGLTIEQAEGLLRENSLYFASDYLWMGPVAFRYYFDAAIAYAQSQAAAGDSGFVASMETALSHRLKYEPSELISIAEKVSRFCSCVLADWKKFECDSAFYRQLRGKFMHLEKAFAKLAASKSAPG